MLSIFVLTDRGFLRIAMPTNVMDKIFHMLLYIEKKVGVTIQEEIEFCDVHTTHK